MPAIYFTNLAGERIKNPETHDSCYVKYPRSISVATVKVSLRCFLFDEKFGKLEELK